ncbi:MAG: hypothetical protein CMJ11_01680 [Pelagibacterales bacterium]|nr:hypothetical protein [Pelagibacterales bacterium]
MDSIWILNLELSNKFREDIESYLISMNATITSLDVGNNANELKPELFNTSAFFIKKPKKYIIKQLFLNFNIKPKEIVLKKVKIQDIYKNNSRSLSPISIGPFNFLESKNLTKFIISKNIIIPAGLGFGTGHHPSTKGILYVLSKIYLKKNINYKNMIDVGCGSGILGITMAKLWKKPIELIDIDNRSIKTSKANAKLNFVNSLIKVKKGNGLNITNEFQYDIIVMNILSNTILKNIKSIDRKLNNNGRAIIAGILNNQKYMILNKLRGLGLVLELEYVINGWVTLLIKKN